jgi:hypothetical protein
LEGELSHIRSLPAQGNTRKMHKYFPSPMGFHTRDAICPGFMGFKELCPGVPKNSVRDAKCPRVFNTAFLSVRTKVLNFPHWEETSAGN